MMRFRKMLLCGGATVALGAAAYGLTAENPYKAITDRNVFGLKDPPPPAPAVDLTKPTPSKITLTGITDILGNKRALMKTAAAPAKPGQEATPEKSYILTIGQREDDIEVLEIDLVAGSVRLKNAGKEELLTLDKDGPKLPSTPAPQPAIAGLPVPTRLPSAVPPPPTGSPTGKPSPINPLTRSIPTTRSLRVPGATSPQASPASYNPGLQGAGYGAAAGYRGGVTPGAGTTPGSVTLPGFTPATPSSEPSMAAMPRNQYTLEEQIILIEANRKNDPFGAMLPPTPLSPNANVVETPQPQVEQPAPQQQNNQFQLPFPPGTPQPLPQ